MQIGCNTYLKMSSITNILENRGTIDKATSEAIHCYTAANGNRKEIEDSYGLALRFKRDTTIQFNLLHKLNYFGRIESMVKNGILPVAERSTWRDIFAAQPKTKKILEKRKLRKVECS